MLFETNTRYCARARCRSNICKKPARSHSAVKNVRSNTCWIVIGKLVYVGEKLNNVYSLMIATYLKFLIIPSDADRCCSMISRWRPRDNYLALGDTRLRWYPTKQRPYLHFQFPRWNVRHKIVKAPRDVVLCYRIIAVGVVSIHSVIPYWAEIYKTKTEFAFLNSTLVFSTQVPPLWIWRKHVVIATTWKNKLTSNKKSKKLVQIRGK